MCLVILKTEKKKEKSKPHNHTHNTSYLFSLFHLDLLSSLISYPSILCFVPESAKIISGTRRSFVGSQLCVAGVLGEKKTIGNHFWPPWYVSPNLQVAFQSEVASRQDPLMMSSLNLKRTGAGHTQLRRPSRLAQRTPACPVNSLDNSLRLIRSQVRAESGCSAMENFASLSSKSYSVASK